MGRYIDRQIGRHHDIQIERCIERFIGRFKRRYQMTIITQITWTDRQIDRKICRIVDRQKDIFREKQINRFKMDKYIYQNLHRNIDENVL